MRKDIKMSCFRQPFRSYIFNLTVSAASARHQGIRYKMAHNLVRGFRDQFWRGPISQPEREAITDLANQIIQYISTYIHVGHYSPGGHINKQYKRNHKNYTSHLSGLGN